MVELELGNIMFNTNKNQVYACPKYVIALLKDISSNLKRVMWNKYQKEYDSPFDNTGNKFKLGNFEVQAYSWDDDISQPYNFIYKVDKSKSNLDDIKISWYKYVGRDTTVNQELDPDVWIDIYNDIMKQINNYGDEILKEYENG